ncbi:Aryl hydrocarbon receptor nuclear translocator-like protein 1 [Armadillidium vulgare]|nr:Aryl hydrocarbon receptor nuclear translocator-like protein 1 [Armadillidium vulgare]
MYGVGYDYSEYRSDCTSGVSASSDDISKKRGEGNDLSTESGKMSRNSSDWNKRQNHSEIEKRRRDKMNNYIMELSSIIPVDTSRKLDKLTVLRMAVQHMKMLRGSLNSYTEGHYKPSFLSDDELKNLILQSELLGSSWFDILHPKDLGKVKEQLSSTDINRRDRLVDAKTLLPVKTDIPQGLSRLCPGFRRSFFCRMRCKSAHVIKEEADTTTGCHKKKNKPHCSDKKYSVIHFTGYLKSLSPSKDPMEEESDGDTDSCNLSCLVAVGRVHQPLLASIPQDSTRLSRFLPAQPITFVSKHTIDGKFVFVDQKASLLSGWLPQELLGTSMYEYFHQDDIPILSDTHRMILQTFEPRQTQVYRFRTKDGSFLNLKSSWKIFRNPWTKDVEYIISSNCLLFYLKRWTGGGSCSSVSSSRIVGTGVQANKIGRNIAEEVLDPQQGSLESSSPVTESLSSPMNVILGSNTDGRNFDTIISRDGIANKISVCGSSSDISLDSDSTLIAPPSASSSKSCLSGTSHSSQQPDPSFSQSNSRIQQVSSNSELMEVVGGRDLESEVTSDSDEAAMAVIMSLLEADAGLGEPVDFSHLPWPLP